MNIVKSTIPYDKIIFAEETLMQLIIFIAVIFTLFSLVYYFKDRDTYDDTNEESEPKIDIETLSHTHYLLEAGKNQWRLNDKYYTNPKALTVYALALICNKHFDDCKKDELESMNVRMRLSYLLYTYTDDNQDMQTRIEQLGNRFLKRMHKIPKELQEIYTVNNGEDILKKLQLILGNAL